MKNLQKNSQSPLLQKSIKDVIADFTSSFNSIKTKRRYQKVLVEFFEFMKINSLEELGEFHITQIHTWFESFKATKIKVESSSIEEHILNPATINNIAYSIKSFFKYLIDYYNYPKNPLSSYKPLKTKQHSSTQSLNRGELLDILKQAKLDYLDILVKSNKPKKHLTKLRDYLIFSLLALSLRREEICKIRWDDFKESSYLHISQKWGSYKFIPLPLWLLDFWMKYKEEKEKNGFKSNYIFTPFSNSYSWDTNKPIYADYIMQITQKMCDRLNINKKITPHSFRKTFIELSLNNNENYNNIMNATGHKTSQMIYYYDYRDKIRNNAINSFWDIF